MCLEFYSVNPEKIAHFMKMPNSPMLNISLNDIKFKDIFNIFSIIKAVTDLNLIPFSIMIPRVFNIDVTRHQDS